MLWFLPAFQQIDMASQRTSHPANHDLGRLRAIACRVQTGLLDAYYLRGYVLKLQTSTRRRSSIMN